MTAAREGTGNRLIDLVEAAARGEERPADGREADAPGRDFRFYRVADLAAVPAVEWQVDEVLTVGGNSMLYGPSGAFKTFVALAIACSIVTGKPVLGRRVRPGIVVYCGLEGFSGLYARFAAWAQAHGLAEGDLRGLVVGRDPVLLHDPASVAAFLGNLAEYGVTKCALVVFDTLARCSVGTDEKDNSHRDLITLGLAHIRRALECGTLLVHHTGWDESRQRGGSALPAALDTILKLRDGPELLVEKHRDADSGLVIPFRTAAIGRSLVALAEEAGDQLGPKPLTPNARKALQALVEIELPGQGASNSDWERTARIAHGTFNRVRKLLLTAGYVSQEKAKAPWRSTPEGREQVGPRTTQGPRSDRGPRQNGRTDHDHGYMNTRGPVHPDRSVAAGGHWCPSHPAVALRPCDATDRLECPNCSPLLFPGTARQVDGGVVIEADPGRPAADSVSAGGA